MLSQDIPDIAPPGQALAGAGYRLLSNIALLGVETGQHRVAQDMAHHLLALRPDLPHAHGIAAMSDVTQGRGSIAVQRLESCLAQFPDFQFGKALLGICMAEAGHSGWQHLLESVIEDGRDEHAVTLACDVLDRPNPFLPALAASAMNDGSTLWA